MAVSRGGGGYGPPAARDGGSADYFGFTWGSSGPVTTAQNATGSGTRYDVTSDAQMDAVPWNALVAGDVVNIFWKASAYLRGWGMRGQGTSTNPIVVNGVTDSTGLRPQFNFTGSTTAAGSNSGGANRCFNPAFPEYGEALGGIVIGRSDLDTYGVYQPKWMQIKNLDLRGARYSTSFTTISGGTYNRGATEGCAGVYLLLVEDFLLENCIITGNSNGLFTMAKDNLYSEACKRITMRYCQIYGNGIPGSFFRHNVYMQCDRPIVEGNYIGPQVAGGLGSCYKSRAGDEIFRYNYVENNARCLDLVFSEEQTTDGISEQSWYGTTRVYGNVIVASADFVNGTAGEPIHFGGDNYGEQIASSFDQPASEADADTYYLKNLFFYNNTIYFKQTQAQQYLTRVFGLSLIATRCDAWDNVIYVNGNTNLSWLEYAGQLHLWGTNVIYHPGTPGDYGVAIRDAFTDAAGGQYAVTNHGTLLTTNPALTAPDSRDMSLGSGSVAENVTPWAPSGLPAVWSAPTFDAQIKGISGIYGMVSRPGKTDIGALERGVY